MTNQYGPRTEEANILHAMKYRGANEDFREAMGRVAFGLKDTDNDYHSMRDILLNMRFLPAGRIQAAIGAARRTTAFNCFVSGSIGDSFVSRDGIMDRAKEAAATMRMGGGIGYDFSTLRPRGSHVAKIDSLASGPVSFMPIYDAVCLATSSYGHRRGAQMAVLRVDHPDIEEFIHAKQNDKSLKGFNMSIGVTDAFMEAAMAGKNFDLVWEGKAFKTIDAASLWQKIMRSTYDWAEPGVLFIDRINNENNLYYCEKIAATNPCGEQPLPPYGACLLGSFNLTKYLIPVSGTTVENLGAGNYQFNFEQFEADIPHVVRAMDNVTDRTNYPLEEQRDEALSKRRMGLGVCGLANAGEALGCSYGSPEFLLFERTVLSTLCYSAYRSSAALAKEKGSFPLFDRDKYLAGNFVSRLPSDIREAIAECGIRNSHLTSIAPTGTISMCADNISSSIEPVFSYSTSRSINTPEGQRTVLIEDYAAAFLDVRGKICSDVTAEEHVAVQMAAQPFVDSAISKTINMDSSMPWENFVKIYEDVWMAGGKGVTTFNIDCKRMALLTASPLPDVEDSGPACEIINGKVNCE
jgi:ribonucleoside-diphosphate reductase alpha chain